MPNNTLQLIPLNQQEIQQYYPNIGSSNIPAQNIVNQQSAAPGMSSALLNYLKPYGQELWSATKELPQDIGAGGLNILKQAENLGSQITGGFLPQANFDPLQKVGLPSDPYHQGLQNLASGGLSTFVGGPEMMAGKNILGRLGNILTSKILPQAGMGAVLDSGNRAQGAEVGGALGAFDPMISGIKNIWGTGESVIDNAKNIYAQKQAALSSAMQKASDNFVSKMIGRRADNQIGFQKAYSAEKLAGNHPIPNLDSPFKTKMNTVADQIDQMFGPTQATDEIRNNPEHFASNYTAEEGFTPDAQNQVDQLLGSPGLGEILSKNYTRDSDLGGNLNPLQPLKVYQNLVMNPTIANASEAKRVFNILKDSDYTASIPGLQSKLKTAANSIDKNMILPGLQDYDSTYGTKLYDQYMKGSPQYREEMEWQKISPKIDALSSGQWLPGSLDYNSVAKAISNAASSNKLPNSELGLFLRKEGSNLQSVIAKNSAKQSQNDLNLTKQIANIRKRQGTSASLGNLAGTTGQIVSPFLRVGGMGALQSNNPQQ